MPNKQDDNNKKEKSQDHLKCKAVDMKGRSRKAVKIHYDGKILETDSKNRGTCCKVFLRYASYKDGSILIRATPDTLITDVLFSGEIDESYVEDLCTKRCQAVFLNGTFGRRKIRDRLVDTELDFTFVPLEPEDYFEQNHDHDAVYLDFSDHNTTELIAKVREKIENTLKKIVQHSSLPKILAVCFYAPYSDYPISKDGEYDDDISAYDAMRKDFEKLIPAIYTAANYVNHPSAIPGMIIANRIYFLHDDSETDSEYEA